MDIRLKLICTAVFITLVVTFCVTLTAIYRLGA